MNCGRKSFSLEVCIVAILKHIASKNANYGSAIDYLKYQHDEFHLVPVLDENGNMMLRDEFYLEGLNCDPETFYLECELLNQEYNKNNTYDEIKSHHYIISHDPKDNTDHNLTGEWAQAIGISTSFFTSIMLSHPTLFSIIIFLILPC